MLCRGDLHVVSRGKDLLLPVKRKVAAKFRDEDRGDEARRGDASVLQRVQRREDGRGQGMIAAHELAPHEPAFEKARRFVIELLGDFLADAAPRLRAALHRLPLRRLCSYRSATSCERRSRATHSGSITCSTTGRSAGQRGPRSRGGDAAFERRGSSGATGSGAFGRSSKPCSMRSSCAASSFCQRPPALPFGQRLRPLAISLRSIRSARRRAGAGAHRSFRAAACFRFARSPVHRRCVRFARTTLHGLPTRGRAVRLARLRAMWAALAARISTRIGLHSCALISKMCGFFRPSCTLIRPCRHLLRT